MTAIIADRLADLLSRICAAADKTLDRPTGNPRRLDEIERLFEEAERENARPNEMAWQPVNDWTVMLLKMLRKLEQLGPLGDAGTVERAMAVGLVLLPHVNADALRARQEAARARPATSDHDFQKR